MPAFFSLRPCPWNSPLQSSLSFQASLVARMEKNLPAMQEPGFNPWVRKIPWRREWQPTPVFLPGEFHGQRRLRGLQSIGSEKESDVIERLTLSLGWGRQGIWTQGWSCAQLHWWGMRWTVQSPECQARPPGLALRAVRSHGGYWSSVATWVVMRPVCVCVCVHVHVCACVRACVCVTPQQSHIMAERSVLLKNVRHPFLVGLRYSFQTPEKLYFVLDYVNGGEVGDLELSNRVSTVHQLLE